MRERSAQGGYYPHIDGMRALAVLAVIVYHLHASWLPGGFTGVDVFFVISGFVVSASLARSSSFVGWRGLLGFYARRMRRIMPALVLCLLTTALLSALFIPDSWLSETSGNTGRMAFFGLSNWVLARTGNDYFSPRSDFNPYTHTWSLGVEEQFYLLFPLLFMAWGKGQGGRRVSMLLFALATAASLFHAMARAHQGGHEVDAFYLTTTRFWQLGIGVLLFQWLDMRKQADAPLAGSAGPWQSLALLVSLVLLGYGLWSARPGHSPWMDGAWPVLGALGLLGLLHHSPGGLTYRVLASRPFVLVGKMSYSLYLWHWPVFVLFRWTVGLDSIADEAAAVLCAVFLAWVSWRWVEQPLRFGSRWRASDMRWVACGFAVLLLGAGVQRHLMKGSRYISLSTVSRNPQDWYPYANGLEKEYPECELLASRQHGAAGDVQQFERGKCDSRQVDKRQFFVAGDSHSLAYGEMFRRFTVLDGGKVRLYGAGGCAVIGLQGWESSNPGCVDFVRRTLDDISKLARAGDVVFLPGLRVPRLVEEYEQFGWEKAYSSQRSEEARATRKKVVAMAVEQLRPLAERGVHIILEAPKPVLPAPPFRCSDVFNKNNPICSYGMTLPRADMEELRAPALSDLQEVAAALPGVSIWDPLPMLCPGQVCLPTEAGKPLYFDGDHLSGHGNRVLLPSFREHLLAIAR